jgi:hypothetical protein
VVKAPEAYVRRFATALLCATLLASACGGAKERDLSISAGGPGEPRIEITSPKTGATVHGGREALVPIVTKVSDFDLADKIGKKAKDGEGHIIFYRLETPDARVPTRKGKSAIAGGRGTFVSHPDARNRYAWPFMPSSFYPPGTYRFAVQLVNNDNSPLVPPKIAEVTVDVAK